MRRESSPRGRWGEHERGGTERYGRSRSPDRRRGWARGENRGREPDRGRDRQRDRQQNRERDREPYGRQDGVVFSPPRRGREQDGRARQDARGHGARDRGRARDGGRGQDRDRQRAGSEDAVSAMSEQEWATPLDRVSHFAHPQGQFPQPRITSPPGGAPPPGMVPPGRGPPRAAPPLGQAPPAAANDGALALLLQRLEDMEGRLARNGPAAERPEGLVQVLSKFNATLERANNKDIVAESKKKKESKLMYKEAEAPRGHGSALKRSREKDRTDPWKEVYFWTGLDHRRIRTKGDTTESGEFVPFFERPANVPHGPNGVGLTEVVRQRRPLKEDEEKTGVVYRTALDQDGITVLLSSLHETFGSTTAEERQYVGRTAKLVGHDDNDESQRKMYSLPAAKGTFRPNMLQGFADTMKDAGVRFADVTDKEFCRGADFMLKHALAYNNATRFLLNELGALVSPLFDATTPGHADKWATFQDICASICEISGQSMLSVAKELSVMSRVTAVATHRPSTSTVPLSAQVETARVGQERNSDGAKLLKESAAAAARKTAPGAGPAPRPTLTPAAQAPRVQVNVSQQQLSEALAARLGPGKPGGPAQAAQAAPVAGKASKTQALPLPGSKCLGTQYDPDFKKPAKGAAPGT